MAIPKGTCPDCREAAADCCCPEDDLETSGRALEPDEARALLRDCVTVLPGETLVVRVPSSWTPGQVSRYQEYLSAMAAGRFPVLVAAADELAVAQPLNDGDLSELPWMVKREIARQIGQAASTVRSRPQSPT